MIDQNMPRVKLPGNIIRTPVVPGPNSWALAQTQQPTINGLANNGQTADKSKYEKPMPEPPKTEVSLPRIMLESKSYIQPAIPLPVSLSNMKNTKNRAVTDPVPPKPLFAERKPSVNKLRRKYSASKLPEEILNDDSEKASDALMTVRLPPEKALQVLGLNPMQDNLQYLSRASTPAPIVMNPFGISYNDEQERSGTPVRQVQSTPAPTRCYLPENGLPTPSLVGPLDVSSPGPDERDRQKPSHLTDDFLGRVSENNLLCPPKVGVFGNVGESKTQIVQENGMQRIESFRGIIEDASANRSCIDRTNVNITGQASRLDLSRGQGFGNIYMEAPYDVGGYGGVWEHDPAVGVSLPPFSPVPNSSVSNSNKISRGPPQVPPNNASREDLASHASFYQGSVCDPSPNPSTNGFHGYQHPFPSANSWASESQSNSFTSTNPPLSALLPPRWPNHHITNSVPSPPRTQSDFQRSGSISSALAQLELNLHHHIDSSFASLTRLITEKHDRGMDQVLRRLEDLENIVGKGFKTSRNDVKDFKDDFKTLRDDLKNIIYDDERVTGMIERLESKLHSLNSSIGERICRCQVPTAGCSIIDHEGDRLHQTSHRRTESAHGALGQSEKRKPHARGASRPTNATRLSLTNSNGNRSRTNTLSGQPTDRLSEEHRREYFAELGLMKGLEPDLREHPAYAGMHQDDARDHAPTQKGVQNLSPFEGTSPSLSDGRWYQQAYGQHRSQGSKK